MIGVAIVTCYFLGIPRKGMPKRCVLKGEKNGKVENQYFLLCVLIFKVVNVKFITLKSCRHHLSKSLAIMSDWSPQQI